jgi:glycerate-2-kinase
LNTIRNHIDQLKGGRLARIFNPATMIHIAVEDLNQQDVGRRRDFDYLMHHGTWLHNMPEGSSFSDARTVLKQHNAWERCPSSIRKVLVEETPETKP